MSVKINLQLLLSGIVAKSCITRATPCSLYSRRWLMRYQRKKKSPAQNISKRGLYLGQRLPDDSR